MLNKKSVLSVALVALVAILASLSAKQTYAQANTPDRKVPETTLILCHVDPEAIAEGNKANVVWTQQSDEPLLGISSAGGDECSDAVAECYWQLTDAELLKQTLGTNEGGFYVLYTCTGNDPGPERERIIKPRR